MISRIDSILFCFLFSIVMYGADRKVVLFSSDRNPMLNENALSAENMIFEIRSIYNLNKKTLHLGRNSIIDVRKGGLRNGTITMASNTSIIGDLENDASGTLKVNVAGKNINISDFRWSNDNGVALQSFADCSNLTISKCKMSSAIDNCVKIVADHLKGVVKGISFFDCDISYKRMGIELQNHGNNNYRFDGVNISNCRFRQNNHESKYGYALSLSGYGRNVVIDNNHFTGMPIGVEIVGFSNVVIRNNYFKNISTKTIVSSNKRKMTQILVEKNQIDCPKSKIQLANTNHFYFKNNDMTIFYLELIGCSNGDVSENIINTNGHYAIIFDGGNKNCKNNIVNNNTIRQGGDNWAIFRCYGKYSVDNRFVKNNISRNNKRGVVFDQMKGAYNNLMVK